MMQNDLSSQNTSLQNKIELMMRQSLEEGRWEAIYLFSSEGLLMSKCGQSQAYSEDKLLEFAFSLIQSTQLLETGNRTNEILIRGKERKNLIFQFFKAWEDNLILAAIHSGNKGYRRAAVKLIKMVQNIK